MGASDSVPAEWLFSRGELFDRLGESLRAKPREISILAGSAVVAPPSVGAQGVPTVSGVIELIKDRLTPTQLAEFEAQTSPVAVSSPYQSAFRFLVSRYGQDAANDVIRDAVWQARRANADEGYTLTENTPDDVFRALETDVSGWILPPAMEAIGGLAATYPGTFGRQLLTTNFDPLAEVSIRKFGGTFYRTVLHADGQLTQTEGTGTHVVHLHGYWHGSDTLHGLSQLSLPRPRLKASLSTLLRNNTLCVTGYGGWDDVFSAALAESFNDDLAKPDVIWCFYDNDPVIPAHLIDAFRVGIQRGRLSLYRGIDAHSFWPSLLEDWRLKEPPRAAIASTPHSIAVDVDIHPEISPTSLQRGGEDRPPLVEYFVGRSTELHALSESDSSIAFITGIGGQGKSAVAAAYFADAEQGRKYIRCVWRDCKEESEHFERQLATIIAGLAGSTVSVFELSRLPISELTLILINLSKDKPILVTFDNIDYYVDLESNKISGGAKLFIDEIKKHATKSRFIFTCRPQIAGSNSVFSLHLSGLTLNDAQQLFAKRKAIISQEDILRAHSHTQGHALWLDLLAAQVARDPNANVGNLLHAPSEAGAVIPKATLDSIWRTLKDRERLVLRTLAESVRPATERELEGYLEGSLRFNQMAKATRYLRSIGLVVIKPQLDGELYLELHPLIRTYIRQTFAREERAGIIVAIINFYNGMVKIVEGITNTAAATERVQRLSEMAELRAEAGDHQEALRSLYRAVPDLSSSENPEAYVGVAGRILSDINWNEYARLEFLEDVVDNYCDILAQLGRFEEARKILGKYRETIKSKTARYVRYCRIMCNLEWLSGDYKEAIAWGEEGESLRKNSGADIPFDTAHYLALARRDSGEIDKALQYFLDGRDIEAVLDPDALDEDRGGAFYGNIGRCLQKTGQVDTALVCYRKSAVLIERAKAGHHVANQAYVRQWIGEVLREKGQLCAAKNFFEAAEAKWSLVSPPKAVKIRDDLSQMHDSLSDCVSLAEPELEKFCRLWFRGEEQEMFVRA